MRGFTAAVAVEAEMEPIGVSRVGDMIHLDFDGETWVIPVDLAKRLMSDMQVRGEVRRELLPSITRRPARAEEE